METKYKMMATFLMTLLLSSSLIAQFSMNNSSKSIDEEKKAFMVKQIGINDTEGQQFWPLYNEYLDKKNLLQEEKNRLTVFYKYNNKEMTENDMEVTMKKYLKIVKAESILEEAYNRRFRKVLPTSKIMKFYVVESEYFNTKYDYSKMKISTIL